MKTNHSRNVAMSDVFRMFAGDSAAQFDVLACTVYSAAYFIMESGNKTQFAKITEDSAMYGTSADALKNIKALFDVKSVNKQVKHFQRTYFAVSEALRQCGTPTDMQKDLPSGKANADARFVILDPIATDYADQFACVFTSVMSMPEKTDEERTEAADKRAASKVARDEEKAAAAAQEARELQAAIDAQVSSRVERATATDIMVQTVVDMLKTGALPAELEALILEAAQTREIARLIVTEPTPEFEPA